MSMPAANNAESPSYNDVSTAILHLRQILSFMWETTIAEGEVELRLSVEGREGLAHIYDFCREKLDFIDKGVDALHTQKERG